LTGSLGVAGDLFGDFLPIILVLLGLGIGIAIFEALTHSSTLDDD
jgi:hypothetical protein